MALAFRSNHIIGHAKVLTDERIRGRKYLTEKAGAPHRAHRMKGREGGERM